MSANAGLYDFMIGAWSVEFDRLPERAQVGRRAIVTVDWFLDNTAILDQWRHVDESGAVNFRGATFRTYLPDKDLWYMLWMTQAKRSTPQAGVGIPVGSLWNGASIGRSRPTRSRSR